MDGKKIKKAEVQNIAKVIEYVSNSVVIKSIIQRTTGTICVVAFDAGEELTGKISRFDTLIQIIDGNAEIVIDNKSKLLKTGQSIIIPANSRNTTRANVRFKMLSTVIKSGYEEVS
jgi:quercetin dioxygenase-like cupin family protein